MGREGKGGEGEGSNGKGRDGKGRDGKGTEFSTSFISLSVLVFICSIYEYCQQSYVPAALILGHFILSYISIFQFLFSFSTKSETN